MRRVMSRTPGSDPVEPTAAELRLAWCALLMRQEAGGGCLGERTRLAIAIARVEMELLERCWAATS